jgi:hypothetical protein
VASLDHRRSPVSRHCSRVSTDHPGGERSTARRREKGQHRHGRGLARHPDMRLRAHAPPRRPEVDVARLFLLADRDFDSARERKKRKRECRPAWPGLHRDGAVVGMRDASDDRSVRGSQPSASGQLVPIDTPASGYLQPSMTCNGLARARIYGQPGQMVQSRDAFLIFGPAAPCREPEVVTRWVTRQAAIVGLRNRPGPKE